MGGWGIKLEKWRDIQTFNPAIRRHFAYAIRLLQTCNRIARRLGQPNQDLVFWHFEEGPLSIECNGGYETRVMWKDQLVFLGFAKGKSNAQIEFQIVRVGIWIEQIVALEARASKRRSSAVDEQVEERARSAAAFGRLPDDEPVVATTLYASNANGELTTLRPKDTQSLP